MSAGPLQQVARPSAAPAAASPPWRNPRRVAPEASVSLRHYPGSFASDQPSVGGVSAASMVAAHGEGRSPPRTNNADKWFDDSNKNAAGKTNVKFVEDDPPFYLKKQRSSEDDGQFSGGKSAGPFAAGPSQLQSANSTSDDYRSVIDDLTVENQELKRKLRKYEAMHCDHLVDDKLFEVRVYGLSPARRRKLEDLLRNFVSGLGPSPPESMASGTQPFPVAVGGQPAAPANPKRRSWSRSNHPVDSAYASMSASNTASVSQTQTQHNGAESRRPIRPAPPPQKDQQVQSYLHTISRGLLPRHPPFMPDEAKKRLVVRRLGQLFVGRGGTSTKHSQSEQQEEVSQSAANADRRETEALGHLVPAEGRREAKMLKPTQPAPIAQGESQDASVDGNETIGSSGAVASDQRPTRPLDLDPARAQNPSETISYMKHLGFASPKMDPARSAGDGEGWVFLNLLINMAQLHTLNVTPDFVRSAISELSGDFELSEDGQNVRWIRGPHMSRLSSDSSLNSEGSNGSPPGVADSAGKAALAGNAADGSRARSGNAVFKPLLHWPNSQNRADHQYYSPLFYYPGENASGSPLEEVSPSSMHRVEEKSNGASRESSAENKSAGNMARETGTLIFYRKARFCTDLKGDSTFPASTLVYERRLHPAIGVTSTQVDTRPMEARGALSSPAMAGPEAESSGSSDEGGDVAMGGFEPFSSSESVKSGSTPARSFSVSGIGGIVPADHFCIDARRQHTSGGHSALVGERRRDLAPTALPPPSYAFMQLSSASESEDDDGDSFVLEAAGALDYGFPTSMAQFAAELSGRNFVPANMLGGSGAADPDSSSGGSGAGAGGSRDTTDGSSFDMLEFARKADPETVAAREREFEDDAAPPASVAATVGDRSTVQASQDDNASVDERHLRMMHERKGGLKRERGDFGGASGHAAKVPRVSGPEA